MATSTPVDVGMPSLPSATSDQQEKATATEGSGQQAGATTGSEDLEQQEHKTGEIRKQGFFKGLKEFFKGLKEYFKNLIEKFTDFFLCLKCCFSCGLCCVETWAPITATFLIYWLIYRPDRFHPRTDSAVLATFDITNDSLRYDLAVDLSFRNTHRVSIRYLDVAASMYYNGTRLGPTDDALPSFRQGPKSTIVLHPAFNGVVTVDSGVASELERERAAGTVHLRVTVSLTLMYKVLFVKDVFFYKYDCWLWFPPPSNNTPALFYGDGTKCWRV